MKLYLLNTMTRQKEEFVPLNPGKAGIYSCGPTVYWDPHIGNLRATWTADLLRNVLQVLGYDVLSVMNITDVGHLTSDADDWEDKLEKWAKREWISAWDVAKKYEKTFRDWLKKMNIDEFSMMPRATEHIAEQIEMIQTLEKKWYVYIVENDWIYMDTSKIEDYWKLIWANYKKRLEELNAGERIDMWWKKNPTDFALWKFSPIWEKRDMERDSPWWIGFPGWHIECSAMSSKYLWEQFDIHHGWSDHITIHHPNEIAQSECAFDKKPWVKYRVHNEFLQVDWWKMSKSLWNVYNLEDIEAKWYSPLDLRYFYFMAQYSNFQNFTWDALNVAKNSRKSLMKKLAGNYVSVEKNQIENYEIYKKFISAIADNLNTPKLLAEINTGLNNNSEWIFEVISYFEDRLLKLGLFVEESISVPQEIIDLADERLQAKKDKNYELADQLRAKISDLWWNVKDTPDSYELEMLWK